ncbi:MAG: hypothetical protein ACTHOU_04660 [Aureliella sp.]
MNHPWRMGGCALALLGVCGATLGLWAQSAPPPPPAPQAIATEHLHNVFQLSDRIFSGSEPKTAAAMAELAQLGIKTIVSVDGIAPNVVLAKQAGMRYIHVPIGYDGVSREAGRALARVAREVPGKIYIHCHHGKHRGPAAAAIVCRTDDGRTGMAARVILEKAGTGREYPGLWRDVASFQPPPAGAALPPLVERAAVESLPAAMARLDRTFDRLKLCAASQWQTPPDHPDITPAREAVQLMEAFAEAARASADNHTLELRQPLAASRQLADALVRALEAVPADGPQADAAMAKLSASCNACHERHRNQK